MKMNLRKIILSMLVITSFAFYATYQRFGDGLQKYINNLQNRQVASESYSYLNASSSKNHISADLPVDIFKEASGTYSQSAVNGLYKDGEYDGRAADVYYGYIQVRAIIESGMLTDVQFLSYPDDRGYSVEINKHAMPILVSEAIKNQSAQVDIVAGATNTSNAFISSLGSALSLAGSSSEIFSVLQAPNSTVDIVSGATNISLSSTGVSAIQNQGTPVNIISGATNISSSSTTVSPIQNQNGAVDIVSGATNISHSSTTVSAIQNQGTLVNIISGATNISSGTASSGEETAEYVSEDKSDDDDKDAAEYVSEDKHQDEYEDESDEKND